MARIAGVMKGLVKWKNVIVGKWHLKENGEMVMERLEALNDEAKD